MRTLLGSLSPGWGWGQRTQADRSAPIVQQAEKLWGGNIAEWAKTGQEAAKAGESLVKYARYLNNVSSARPAETSGKPASTAGMAYEDI